MKLFYMGSLPLLFFRPNQGDPPVIKVFAICFVLWVITAFSAATLLGQVLRRNAAYPDREDFFKKIEEYRNDFE